jgi:flagellar hook-associated protein 2
MSLSINFNGATSTSANVGLGAGIDVTAVVDQILSADRGPEALWKSQQSTLNLQTSSWNTLKTNISALLEKVNSLSDVIGVFTARMATSSAPGVVTANAQDSAAIGNHVITVANLATTSSYYSAPLPSSSSTFTTGSFDLQVGSNSPITVTVDGTNNTLDKLAAYINNHSYGVSASVVTDASGARLALISNTSGQPGDLSITSNSTGLSFTKSSTGTNASLTLDGVPISSSSNTVTGALSGVTLQLTGTSAPPVQVNIAQDTAGIKQAIVDFVSSYNTVIAAINLQYKVDPTTYTAGVLANDSTLRSVQTSLLNDVTYAITGNNGFINLAAMGVDMQNDGTLTVDDATLSDAVTNHVADIQNFFQSASPAGFGSNFSTDLINMVSSQGPIQLDLSQITQAQKTLTDQINHLEDRLAIKQTLLIKQYSQVNAALQQFPLLMQQITDQLSILTTKSS